MKNKDALFRAAMKTFEELAYLLPLEAAAPRKSGGEKLEAAALVKFAGPFKGSLSVKLYGDLLSELSSNMLGSTEPPARKIRKDALGELANVVCGNALPLMSGGKSFKLKRPSVSLGADKKTAGSLKAELRLEFRNGSACIRLFEDKR